MLEAQLSELNESTSDAKAKLEAALYDLSQGDETIQGLKEDLEKAEKSLAAAQKSRQKATESSVAAQQAADSKKARMVETLQREIQALQQQMSKKSSAAQRLLQEREAECMELRKTNKKLQHEVDKGTLSDRRIFELAAKQSNRDTAAVTEIEIRDELVNRLTEKLVSRDGDLATAEINVQQVEGRVEELCRVHRREDVNLDYLKSIVVQYLSKPPGSSERSALLPVLATLLQFDPSDYQAIEAGQQKVSWWGTVEATYIDRTPSSQVIQPRASQEPQQVSLLSPVASKVSSAEVKISKPANGTNGSTPGTSSKRKGGTSLQF
uniref:GRIP domain-containing protein n=2 Tax=Attheya septentrionalis TaxID=420275 RepID=A0A7S2ULP5_9STRA|mmetsp:Transcript_28655/g.52390  ORF Transcript_28655/g.52390 Transcript_28655/m.52390 type:complete len:323 (+) Transcript_28655:112-1080(+)